MPKITFETFAFIRRENMEKMSYLGELPYFFEEKIKKTSPKFGWY